MTFLDKETHGRNERETRIKRKLERLAAHERGGSKYFYNLELENEKVK